MLGLPLDEKEQKSIERRRRVEAERRERIHIGKSHLKGVDPEALRDQIAMKREKADMERSREMAITNEVIDMDKRLKDMHAQQEEFKRRINEEIQKTNWMMANNKKANEVAMRRSMSEVPSEWATKSLGASSMSKFAGEDPNYKDRIREQRQQIKLWADMSRQEKYSRRQAELREENEYARQVLEIAQKTRELEARQKQAKQALAAADAEYNRSLHVNRQEATRQRRQSETFAERAEVQNNISSDVLNETENITSSLSPTRVVPYEFKGMSPHRRQSILEEQEKQRAEREMFKRRQDEERRAFEMKQEIMHREMLVRDREVARQRADMERKIREEHMRMAAEKYQQAMMYRRESRTEAITEDFFSKFGSSSR